MTKYEFRHREKYRNVSIDIRAHTEEDLLFKVSQKKAEIDSHYNVASSAVTSIHAGDIGESVGIEVFTKAGFIVSKPLTSNVKYDFIADYGGRLFKVQVKTTKKENDYGSMSFNLRSTNLVKGKWCSHVYTKNDVDLFFLYCIETDWIGIYFPEDNEYLRASITVSAKGKPSRSGTIPACKVDFLSQLTRLLGKNVGTEISF